MSYWARDPSTPLSAASLYAIVTLALRHFINHQPHALARILSAPLAAAAGGKIDLNLARSREHRGFAFFPKDVVDWHELRLHDWATDLLQNSPATVNGTIGVLPVPRQMAQTPSSPLIAATAAAATEEAARANSPSISEQQPISIIESANDLAREHAEEYNAKLMVFQSFCAKFEEAAQQFATGPQRRFARQLADSFLGIWKRELSGSGPTTPKPITARMNDKARMSHHKSSRAFVPQAQLYQEHHRASWWPQRPRSVTKQRRSPSIPGRAHRESAE
ncbi:hypothetical protein NW765_017688 [Fusarium oxysporum]|nr:hypothetical protein NW765_017688 [Fusarium oxysporum]KAJ4254834.1 hypothetical protein NW764_016358 [Fusarium oxysporum]